MIMMILNMYWDRTNHVNSLHEYHESLECVSCFFSWLIIRHHQRVIRGSNWVEINDHESTWDFPNMEMSLSIWWINTPWWTIVKAVSEQTVGIILFYFLNGSILMLFISHTITLQQLILVYCSPLSCQDNKDDAIVMIITHNTWCSSPVLVLIILLLLDPLHPLFRLCDCGPLVHISHFPETHLHETIRFRK